MDDSCCGVKVPIYGSNTSPPSTWSMEEGDTTKNGNVTDFNFNHAFWITNMVANFAYMRWGEVYPEVAKHLVKYELEGFELSAALDKEAELLIS